MSSQTRADGSPATTSDAGFTLVELLVVAALTVVVLVVASGLFLSAARANSTVSAQTAAANLGQLVARSVTQGIANATAVGVVADGTGAQLLQARVYTMSPTVDPTIASSSGVACRAWYYTPTGGGAVYTKSTTPAAPIAMPSGTPDSSWTLIGNGLDVSVSASGSSTIFAAPSGTRVDLKFDVVDGADKPVHIETTVHVPNPTTVSSPCF